jgi:hypothetical protein
MPLRYDPTPTTTLIGKMSSPVLITDSCRACCKYSDRQISPPYRHRLNTTPTAVPALRLQGQRQHRSRLAPLGPDE